MELSLFSIVNKCKTYIYFGFLNSFEKNVLGGKKIIKKIYPALWVLRGLSFMAIVGFLSGIFSPDRDDF